MSNARDAELRTVAIDDPVAWAFVSQSVTRATVLTHLPDGVTSMRPLLHYSSVAACLLCRNSYFLKRNVIFRPRRNLRRFPIDRDNT